MWTLTPKSLLLLMVYGIFADVLRVVAVEDEINDPYGRSLTPLRETMRDKHHGVTITVQMLDFQHKFFGPKFRNFERLTGATIQEVNTTTSTRYDDVLDDIKNHEVGFIDLYATFGNWIPQFASLGGLMDISSKLDSVGLDWFDIMPAVRAGVATYKQKVYAVPLDGDVILMMYRKDLVEDVGLPTPRSWDDVLEILEYYEDIDINGDGVADYYGNCFATAEKDITDKVFWSIASSFLQTKATSQGTFFDPNTMEPISSTPKFLEVLELMKKLVDHSPFRDSNSGVTWRSNLNEFAKGRCVLWYNYPGPTRKLISDQGINNMSGVLNLAPLPGMRCKDSDHCPHATDGINFAPFLASGGMAVSVNSRVPAERQRAALDFAFYLSDPAVSFWDVANPNSFFDPLRRRHTASLTNFETREAKSFLSFGWEARQLPMLKDVTEFCFMHENYVVDLRVFGAEEYQEEATVPHLIKMWDGTNDAQTTAGEITKSWNAVTERYGLEEQRAMYRDTLNLPEYKEKLSRLNQGLIIGIVVTIGVVILTLVAVIMKQRYTIKYKTRDVEAAPKSGTIALIFTDIEGSTSLWDASRSAMSKGLEIHHDVVRQCIEKYKAYEVKTIGDAFMIAVDSADKAVCIANDIQTDLLNANGWPLELAELPAACVAYFPRDTRSDTPAKPMFKGLRVRIGVHIGDHSDSEETGGQIQVLYDQVTKGYDYYGPTANAAARIEGVGFGGQTIISKDVYQRLSDNVKRICSIGQIGQVALKGVSDELFLYHCLPNELRGRKFNGVCRRNDSLGSSLQDTMLEELRRIDEDQLETDKTVDPLTLTPVELQTALRRLQNYLMHLEDVTEMEKQHPQGGHAEEDDDISYDGLS